MTKNIQISFRLTPYQLAHGLEILKGLEPSYNPSSLTAMVKMIYGDWIAKMSAATKPWPSNESLQAIKQIMMQTAAGRKAIIEQDHDQELALIAQDVASGGSVLSPPGLLVEGTKGQASDQATIEVRQAMPTIEQALKDFDIDEVLAFEQDQIRKLKSTESITKVVTDFSPPTMEELTGGRGE